MLRKNFFSKNFEALHRDSAERYGDSADEILAGVEACDVPMGASSMVPRQLQLLFREKGEGRRDETLLPSGSASWVFVRQSRKFFGLE